MLLLLEDWPSRTSHFESYVRVEPNLGLWTRLRRAHCRTGHSVLQLSPRVSSHRPALLAMPFGLHSSGEHGSPASPPPRAQPVRAMLAKSPGPGAASCDDRAVPVVRRAARVLHSRKFFYRPRECITAPVLARHARCKTVGRVPSDRCRRPPRRPRRRPLRPRVCRHPPLLRRHYART